MLKYATRQETMAQAGQFSFVNSVIIGVHETYNEEIMKAVRAVEVEEIKRVFKEVLMPAFEPGKANLVVTCANVMEEVCSFHFISLLPSPLNFARNNY